MVKINILALSSLAGLVSANCAGFNYGIGNAISLGNGVYRWNVYDDSCKIVDGLTTNKNPCTQGIFGCSPPPIIFNRYTNSFSHLIYACRKDGSSGTCPDQYGGTDTVSVCCRNDGH